jgi:protocatechuate 3,4-dioxygenase beta subunit
MTAAERSFGRVTDALLGLVTALALLVWSSQLLDTSLFRRPPSAQVEVAEPGGASVVVKTVDPEGLPLEGALVRLFVLDEAGVAKFAGERWGPTDRGVRFDGVPPREVWLVAYGEGRARASQSLVLGAEDRAITLMLHPAESLRVKLVDDEERPVASTFVTVRAGEGLAHVTATDAEGLARFDRLREAPFAIEVAADGYNPVSKVGVYPEDGVVTLKLERLSGFAVHVDDVGGGPAAFAEVLISGPGLWPARRATADEEGNLDISGLHGGVYDLKARLDDKVSPTSLSVLLPKGQTLEHRLVLEEGRYVVVTVTDGPMREDRIDPKPVEGAGVLVVEDGLSAFPLEGTTGEQGIAIVGPLSGTEVTVSARAAGFVPRVAASEDVVDDQVTIPLLRGATLVGRVRDDRGFPVDGATIEVFGTDVDGMPIHEVSDRSTFTEDLFAFGLGGPVPLLPRGELGVMPGPVPPIPHASATLLDERVDNVAPWVTDSFGMYRASPITPGRVQILVRHPEFTETLSDVLTLGPGTETTVDLVLLPGGGLMGRVVEEDRFAVVGARIELAAVEGTFQTLTYTDDDGGFAVAGLPSKVLLTVYRGESLGEVAARMELEIEPKKRRRVEITLPKIRDPSTFRFVDRRGMPVARAEVRVQSLDLETVLTRTLFSDEDGLVEVPGARGLPLRVVVERPGFATYFDTLGAAEKKHQFTLSPGLKLGGYVTAREGRVKVESASITLFTLGAAYHLRTDEEGYFEQADLGAGRVRIIVRHDDYAKVERVLAFDGEVDRTTMLETIDLSPAGSVEGKVVDDAGDPIAGARVGLDAVPTYLPPGRLPGELAQTDADGNFLLGGLPARLCKLVAYSPELGRGVLEGVDVRADRTTRRITIVIPAQDYTPPKILGGGSVALTLAERAGKVVVVDVPGGGQAELAGIEPDDVFVSIAGAPVSSLEGARSKLSGPATEDVVIEVSRSLPSGEVIPITLRVRRESVRR